MIQDQKNKINYLNYKFKKIYNIYLFTKKIKN